MMFASKNFELRSIIPFTFILFQVITFWTYADIEDGPDVVMYGFPFLYKAPALYTSMATNYFLLEFIADCIFMMLLAFLILVFAKRFIKPIKISTRIWKIIYFILGIYFMAWVYICYGFGDRCELKRNYRISINAKGVLLFNPWKSHPDYYQYHKK